MFNYKNFWILNQLKLVQINYYEKQKLSKLQCNKYIYYSEQFK